MTDKKEKLYRVRSKAVPEWYVVERDEHFGRVSEIDAPLVRTQKWWEENLSSGWEAFFVLEEVDEAELEQATLPKEKAEE